MGSAVSVTPSGGSSSSTRVSVADVTGSRSLEGPPKRPLTVISSSCSSIVLLVGVILKMALALRSLAGRLISKVGTVSNPTTFSFPDPTTAILISLALEYVPPVTLAVTVTTVVPASSSIEEGLTESATPAPVPPPSSSVSVRSAEATGSPLSSVPLTVIRCCVSTTLSFTGVSVKVPVALWVFAGMLMVKLETGSKSTAPAPEVPATLTVTVLAAV